MYKIRDATDENKCINMFVSFTHQAVKRGRRPEPPPPPRLDRSDGGVHEPAAQVCVFDPTWCDVPASPVSGRNNNAVSCHGAAAGMSSAWDHMSSALVVTVEPLKCKVRLSDRQTVFTRSPPSLCPTN